MPELEFTCVNHDQADSDRATFDVRDFALAAKPDTDIYCSPLDKSSYVFNAPSICASITKNSFESAAVRLSFKPILQFDQAGLLFTLPLKTALRPDAHNANASTTHPAWIKAGIEVNDGESWISVVARAHGGWCDWSLVPLPKSSIVADGLVSMKIELTRFKNALMIWAGTKEHRMLIRKVPWVFLDDGQDSIQVGAYAARPDPDKVAAGANLQVDFKDLVIATSCS